MAQRDKSQGFGFMYVDLAKLLAQRNEIEKSSFNTPVESGPAKTLHFNRDPQPAKVTPITRAAKPSPAEQTEERKQASESIRQIRQNLDRLQSLHHKLHAMLEELSHITDTEKKKG